MIHHETSLNLARIGEVAAIARMSRDLIEQGLDWSWTPNRVAASVRNRSTNVVVARSGNRIAGFGIMRYRDDDAHLDLLGVDPEFRSEGIGRDLVRWLEKPALLGGISKVILEVRRANLGAQAFYDRLGYRKLAVLDGYYQGRESAVRMGRELADGVL